MKIKSLLSILALCVISAATTSQAVAQQYRQDYTINKRAHQRSSAPKVDMIYGVMAGVVLPNLRVEGNSADIDNKAGFKVGMMWGLDWGAIEFVPEIWYSTNNMAFNDDKYTGNSGDITNNSIDVPLVLALNLWEGVRINLGPTLSLMCDNNVSTTDGDNFDFGRIKQGVGFMGGISATLFEHMLLDVRYTGRFSSNTNVWNNGGDEYDIKCYDISVSVGYKF